jgi:hypothetical protein
MDNPKRKVKNLRIRFVDNGFIWEASEYSDGSGPDIEVFKTPKELKDALVRVLERQ